MSTPFTDSGETDPQVDIAFEDDRGTALSKQHKGEDGILPMNSLTEQYKIHLR